MKPVAFFSVLLCCFLLRPGLSAHGADPQSVASTEKVIYQYEIPPQLTADEKKWFKTFQEGNFLSDGWQEISNEIMAKTPPDQQADQKIALDNLGRKIGIEWCRANGLRKVNSSMLKEWGDILRKTARTNPQELSAAIASIDQKVDDVLD